jgi:hypothetical protein
MKFGSDNEEAANVATAQIAANDTVASTRPMAAISRVR